MKEEKPATAVAKFLPALLVLGAALASWKLLGGAELIEGLSKKELAKEYDYIIVGGGTSGGVIASRLAEEKKVSILLIEAGGNPETNPDIDVPINTDRVRGNEEWDWSYQTVPQKTACKSHVDKSSILPAGKGLGGTSNINYMQYLRGSRHDYDEWANQGATGWSYKDVLPYFIKSEDNQNGGYVRTVFHGFGGRMAVKSMEMSPINNVMQKTFEELGIKTRDINGRNMFGYSPTQATVRRGMRWGTYRAFIRRVLHVDNLHVLTGAHVHKILFEGRKAVGVEVQIGDEVHTVKANKEIVLAAGAIGSPKLLMLSGVGPRNHLKDLKIPLVMDLPVGNNLQDHVMSDGIEFFTPHKGISITAAKAENFWQSWAYTVFGWGMKSSPRMREGTAYIKLKHQPPQYKYPLIALHLVANTQVYQPKALNINEEDYDILHGDPPEKEGFTIFPVLLHPRSRGTVRLASANPDDKPLINPNYLQEDADITYLISGNWTTAYLECYLRHITLPGYSPVGTCKMGALGDPTAVVDPLLRVRGIKGLRVADASVIPSSVSGNTYATQVMIGEKAADLIRDKDTVKPIREYFKHLLDVKHDRIMEDEQGSHEAPPGGEDEEQVKEAKIASGHTPKKHNTPKKNKKVK